MSSEESSIGTGWACPELLHTSFFLRACALQAVGSELTLDEGELELPPVSESLMVAALALQLPEPRPSATALQEAGVALQALLAQPLPACAPAAIFQAPYCSAIAALSPPALVALLLVSDLAALPAPTLTVLTACAAQRYASLPAAAFEAELAAASPRPAGLVRAWWKASFACPELQWWEGKYGVPPDCRAWLCTSLPYATSAKLSLPPIAFGLEETSPPEEYWARGLDKSGQPPPPSYAAMLPLAFGMHEWVQRHQPGLLEALPGLRSGDDSPSVSLQVLQIGMQFSDFMHFVCGGLWFSREHCKVSPGRFDDPAVPLQLRSKVLEALQAHQGNAGIVQAACSVLPLLGEQELDCAAVLPPVLAALQAHAGDAAVAGSLCRAVALLASGPGWTAAAAASSTASAVQAVAAAVAGGLGGQPRLALHACQALLEVARRGARAAAAGAAPAVLAALQAHASNAAVGEAACAALLCLAQWEQQACLQAGAVQVLGEALAQATGSYALCAQAAMECLAAGSPVPGRCLVCASSSTLGVWDLATGVCLRVLQGHTGAVTSVCALPGGRIVSGAEDRTLRVWEAATGVCLRVHDYTRAVVRLQALHDGRTVVAVSYNAHGMGLWDPDTGVMRWLQGPPNEIMSVCTLEGRVVSATHDGRLRVWDAATGGRVQELARHTDWVRVVRALGDGRLVSGGDDKALRVWDAASGACLQVLERQYEGNWKYDTSVCALGEGRFVSMSSSDKNTLRVWDAATAVCKRVLEGHTSAVLSVCALGGGRILSGAFMESRGWDEDIRGELRVWDADTGECERVLKDFPGNIFMMCALL